MIDHITHQNILLAIIIRNDFNENGITFFTDNSFSQQLGYMKRCSGYKIQPHRHNMVERKVLLTQEVLFLKSGKIRVDFYSDNQIYVQSIILLKGDVILLAGGGHGFEMLEDSEIIEVKQGPYCGEEDKVRFKSVSTIDLKIVE
jgi:hypothetical protein